MKNIEKLLVFTNDDDSKVEVKEGSIVSFILRHQLQFITTGISHVTPEFQKARIAKIKSHMITLDVSTENNSHVLSLPFSAIAVIKLIDGGIENAE